MPSTSSLSGAFKNSILAVLTVVILHILLKQYYEPFKLQGLPSPKKEEDENILEYLYDAGGSSTSQHLLSEEKKKENENEVVLPMQSSRTQDMSIDQYLGNININSNSISNSISNTQQASQQTIETMTSSSSSKKEVPTKSATDVTAFGGFDTTSSSSMFSWWA